MRDKQKKNIPMYNNSRGKNHNKIKKDCGARTKKKTPSEKNLHRSLSKKIKEALQYANRYECFCLK